MYEIIEFGKKKSRFKFTCHKSFGCPGQLGSYVHQQVILVNTTAVVHIDTFKKTPTFFKSTSPLYCTTIGHKQVQHFHAGLLVFEVTHEFL